MQTLTGLPRGTTIHLHLFLQGLIWTSVLDQYPNFDSRHCRDPKSSSIETVSRRAFISIESDEAIDPEIRRRSLLKGLAASVFQIIFRPRLRLQAGVKRSVTRRVRPSDPLWPSTASWEKLKAMVGGNLLQPQALFAACQTNPNDSACTEVLKNIQNPIYIGDQAGTEVSGWLDAWTPAPSAYAVAARNAAEVNFARENNLRLVVKGTGHSYLGTSNAPDSLLVWTRAMNKVTLHEAFVGQGCEGRTAPVPAVTADSFIVAFKWTVKSLS